MRIEYRVLTLSSKGLVAQRAAKIGELAASYATNSPTNREIRLLLENLNYALGELAPLLTALKNRPNSLIFSGKDAAEPEPESKPN